MLLTKTLIIAVMLQGSVPPQRVSPEKSIDRVQHLPCEECTQTELEEFFVIRKSSRAKTIKGLADLGPVGWAALVARGTIGLMVGDGAAAHAVAGKAPTQDKFLECTKYCKWERKKCLEWKYSKQHQSALGSDKRHVSQGRGARSGKKNR